MSRYRKDVGDFGEAAAAAYLEAQGYEILCRNYRTPAGELDLVARQGGCLVFAEVKTRSTVNYGLPAEAVGWRKQAHMRQAAARWLEDSPFEGEMRFDVLEVLVSSRGGQFLLEGINHLPGVILEE